MVTSKRNTGVFTKRSDLMMLLVLSCLLFSMNVWSSMRISELERVDLDKDRQINALVNFQKMMILRGVEGKTPLSRPPDEVWYDGDSEYYYAKWRQSSDREESWTIWSSADLETWKFHLSGGWIALNPQFEWISSSPFNVTVVNGAGGR